LEYQITTFNESKHTTHMQKETHEVRVMTILEHSSIFPLVIYNPPPHFTNHEFCCPWSSSTK